MDWIEQLFGVSPDHGDHSVEISLTLGVAAALLALLRHYQRRRQERSASRAI